MSGHNIFRTEYKELTPFEVSQLDALKATAQGLWDVMATAELDNGHKAGASRHLSLARTRLEESIMWAVKGMTG